MAKTICIPEDLEKSLVDTLFDHLNYQIYEVDHACEYGTETVSMLDFLDLLVNEVRGVPLLLGTADIEDKVLKHFEALLGVSDLWMELDGI